MGLILWLMLVTGMGLILFVVPALTLATLVVAAISGKMNGFMRSLGHIIAYLFWFGAGVALLLTLPRDFAWLDSLPWWFPLVMLWLLLGCIPHVIILIRARREKNRLEFWVGLLGTITTALASLGIEMIFNGTRLY